jgi:DNA modification methylase
MIWQKYNFSHPAKNRYHQIFEYMFVFSKGKPKTFNPIKDRKNKWAGEVGGLCKETYRTRDGYMKEKDDTRKIIAEYGMRLNIWNLPNAGQEQVCQHLAHPAVMAYSVARDHILSWSNDGDTVLDPFMGSATTGVAAIKLNRNFIGIEREKEYVKIAKLRLKGI